MTVINKQKFISKKKKKILSRAGFQTKQTQMKLSEKKLALKKLVIKITSGCCRKNLKCNELGNSDSEKYFHFIEHYEPEWKKLNENYTWIEIVLCIPAKTSSWWRRSHICFKHFTPSKEGVPLARKVLQKVGTSVKRHDRGNDEEKDR